jgi:hypothetical protein
MLQRSKVDIRRQEAERTANEKREEEKRRKEKLFAAVKKKKYQELVDEGKSNEEAEVMAETEARRNVEGGCFIASAAFENSAAREVKFLRLWRDSALLPHWYGRSCINFYYALSPWLALILLKSGSLRSLSRSLLKSLCRRIARRDQELGKYF